MTCPCSKRGHSAIQSEAPESQVFDHSSVSFIPTCVIADHGLVAAYLSGVLECDASVALITFNHVVECTNCQRRGPFFIVDCGGLRLPFSQCLITLRRKFGAARYLVLGHDRSQEDVMRIVQLGADGFIPYHHVANKLLEAVHAIAAGRVWVDRPTMARLLRSNGRAALSRDQSFTSRENQILELAKGRLTNKEIGAVLGIQESTVKYHLTNIFSKLGVGTRDDLLEDPDPSGCWTRLLEPTNDRASPD